jgi:hypothetical protein
LCKATRAGTIACVSNDSSDPTRAPADGSFNPFTGPITKADGSEGVAAGVSLTDPEIIAMDWHVKGVATPLPQ